YAREKNVDLRSGGRYVRARTPAPSREVLNAAFSPKECVMRYRNGASDLKRCFIYSFTPVFASFMNELRPHLGGKPIAALFEALERAGKKEKLYRCEYIASGKGANGRDKKRASR